jgi:hypothetical protein
MTQSLTDVGRTTRAHITVGEYQELGPGSLRRISRLYQMRPYQVGLFQFSINTMVRIPNGITLVTMFSYFKALTR